MDENYDNNKKTTLLNKLNPWRNLRSCIALIFVLSTLLLASLLSVLIGRIARQQI